MSTSASKTRLMRLTGMATALIALILLILNLMNQTDTSILIPVVLLGMASALMLASRNKNTDPT